MVDSVVVVEVEVVDSVVVVVEVVVVGVVVDVVVVVVGEQVKVQEKSLLFKNAETDLSTPDPRLMSPDAVGFVVSDVHRL